MEISFPETKYNQLIRGNEGTAKEIFSSKTVFYDPINYRLDIVTGIDK